MIVTTPRKDIQEQFHKAVLEAFERHGFQSYRHAELLTGVNYSTIYAMASRKRVPTRGQVIEWAEGLKEPINEWLELAGYDPIPSALVQNGESPANDTERFIIRAYRGGNPKERKKLEEIARKICEEEEKELRNGEDTEP